MASHLHRTHFLSLHIPKPITFPSNSLAHCSFIHSSPTFQCLRQHCHVSFLKATPTTSIIQSSLSSSPNPPTSKEEAINQAKISLSTALEKPLNNPKLIGKLKKLKQPRFRVEIPIVDDSLESLTQLALDVFDKIPIRRTGSPVKILILWPNLDLKEAAIKAFLSRSSTSSQIEHVDIPSINVVDPRVLNSADVAIFLVPESSQLAVLKTVTDVFYPKPVVLLNPKWAFEEEADFGDLSGFVGSFEVLYSFIGLEVRGVLSKRKGVVFKCVRDGVVSGERWAVHVEEGGELKVVSKFKARPTIGEVENVLYNLMAINSPVTKSAKFLKDGVQCNREKVRVAEELWFNSGLKVKYVNMSGRV